MAQKICLLVLITLLFYVLGYFVFRRKMKPYHARTWALIEGFWYVVSFFALCVGLTELSRIEKLDEYKKLERAIDKDYDSKKSLLYAQAWILRLDHELPVREKDGVIWFHKMRSYFEEGMNSNRWQNFLEFSKSYMKGEQRSDVRSRSIEYGWPTDPATAPESIYLKEDIQWMLDSLSSFSVRKIKTEQERPEDFTNFRLRYFLIVIFLLSLALKFLKIYADYLKNSATTDQSS